MYGGGKSPGDSTALGDDKRIYCTNVEEEDEKVSGKIDRFTE